MQAADTQAALTKARQARQLLEAHLAQSIARRGELLEDAATNSVIPPDENLSRELQALGYVEDE